MSSLVSQLISMFWRRAHFLSDLNSVSTIYSYWQNYLMLKLMMSSWCQHCEGHQVDMVSIHFYPVIFDKMAKFVSFSKCLLIFSMMMSSMMSVMMSSWYHEIDLFWKTEILGGKLAKFSLHLNFSHVMSLMMSSMMSLVFSLWSVMPCSLSDLEEFSQSEAIWPS